MSTEEKTETRLQRADAAFDSTQQGCTSSLLISCIVLTLTTAFVFGWGLGAPNMYNKFTEPFLEGQNPCQGEAEAGLSLNQTTVNVATMESTTVVADDQKNLEAQTDQMNIASKSQSAAEKKEIGKFNFFDELIKGIPQTIFLIGAFFGAITGPIWVNALDRKRTVYANYVFCFASSLCVLIASYANKRLLFHLSRLILGYQGGMACVVVPPFIGEISSQRVRGAAGTAFQLSLTIGILTAQIVGLPFIAGQCDRWGWGLAVVFLLPLAGLFVLFIVPNSPTQMIAKYNNEEQAIKDLKILRKTDNIQADLQVIQEQTRKSSGGKTEPLPLYQIISLQRYRWPMLITVALQLSQALSGINAVFFYSSKMFASAGISEEWIPYANIGTGVINVLVTVMGTSLIEKFGRRPLIVYPMAVMVVVFGILTVLVRYNASRNSATLSVVSVIFILLFIVCFAVGLGPIPFLYGTEVCRPEVRDGVQSLGLVANYSGNILLSLFFPALNEILGGYVFLIFLVLISLNLILFYFKMPETKNKSIEDSERFWGIQPVPQEKLLPQSAASV